MSFEIRSMVLGMVQTNFYLVINMQTRRTLLVDPADNGNGIASYLQREGLQPAAILLTHGHFDHIMGVPELVQRFHLPVYAHEQEIAVLADPYLYTGGLTDTSVHVQVDHPLKDGDELLLADARIQVLHTPGHTQGSVSYYIDEMKVVFCGDTLFQASVGRTDLPTGNTGTLIRSIRKKLFLLQEDVTVLPGHGPSTTIGWERENNPYVKVVK